MRGTRFAIGRFIVLAVALAHWVGTSPSVLARDLIGHPSLDRLDPQSVVVSHRAPTAVSIKQPSVDPLPRAPADDAAATVSAADIPGSRSGSIIEGPLEAVIPSVTPAYRARAPPVA
jgi:hypothetical protein